MLKVQEIREIIRLIDQSTISEFTYENEGTVISLKKNGNVSVESVAAQAPVVTETKPTPQNNGQKTVSAPTQAGDKQSEKKAPSENGNDLSQYHKIESPMVGTFYAAPSPDDPPYVKVGDKVTEESIVCIVEAMKLFNEIEAEVNGEIVEILVENGQLVEYGQPLFLVKPE